MSIETDRTTTIGAGWSGQWNNRQCGHQTRDACPLADRYAGGLASWSRANVRVVPVPASFSAAFHSWAHTTDPIDRSGERMSKAPLPDADTKVSRVRSNNGLISLPTDRQDTKHNRAHATIAWRIANTHTHTQWSIVAATQPTSVFGRINETTRISKSFNTFDLNNAPDQRNSSTVRFWIQSILSWFVVNIWFVLLNQ